MSLFGLCLAAPAGAQQADSLRRELRLPGVPTLEMAARGTRAAPGISIGTPSAFGAEYGDAFVGVGVQATSRASSRPDGAVVVGFGVGNASELVGLEVALSGFGTVRSCCRGGASFKLHRALPWDAAVAIGLENGAVWGELAPGVEEGTDAGRSVYGVASKVFGIESAVPLRTLTLSLGAGNGRFRTESAVLEDREMVNAFGSMALRFTEHASAIANWTGQDLVAGVSWLPLGDVPLIVNPAVADLTTRPRFVLGIGYGFDYSELLP